MECYVVRKLAGGIPHHGSVVPARWLHGSCRGTRRHRSGRRAPRLATCRCARTTSTGPTVHTDRKDDDQGSWKASPVVTGFARWPLTDLREGWTRKTTLGQLKRGVRYNLYGWTEDNSSSAANVTFTKEDLVRLKPGQVLYSSGKTNADGTEDLSAVSSESEFRTNACNLFS